MKAIKILWRLFGYSFLLCALFGLLFIGMDRIASLGWFGGIIVIVSICGAIFLDSGIKTINRENH